MSKRRGSIQALCKQRVDFVEKTFDLLGARCILVLLRVVRMLVQILTMEVDWTSRNCQLYAALLVPSELDYC